MKNKPKPYPNKLGNDYYKQELERKRENNERTNK